MKLCYVDTSCLVAGAFGEAPGRTLSAKLQSFDQLIASNLLEAELRAAFEREGLDPAEAEIPLSWITWVYPNRPLSMEMTRILSLGYLRGADLWHLACALFLEPEPGELHFLTLDGRQAEIATALGFPGL